jgi:hypothetical protein
VSNLFKFSLIYANHSLIGIQVPKGVRIRKKHILHRLVVQKRTDLISSFFYKSKYPSKGTGHIKRLPEIKRAPKVGALTLPIIAWELI